ncbi:MAG: VTT domain-containing protein [Kiritimatiellae bacterium]|nr:VTT domain-containing protein [Kiritimatiellia bacterium]
MTRETEDRIASDRGPVGRAVAFGVVSVLLLAASVLLPLREWWQVERLVELGRRLGPWGPVAIVVVGLVAPLLMLPRWPIAVVSGLLYGIGPGAALANTASTLGALMHYALARSMLAPWCRSLLERRRSRWLNIPPGRAFAALVLLRAFPLSNFVATNILAGTLRVPASTYLAASFLGMIPSSVMYAAWGRAIRRPSPASVALALGLLGVLLVGSWLMRRRGPPGASGA